MTQQPTAAPSPAPAAPQPTSAAKPGRLAIPDLISIGIFTALYFVCVCVATLVSTLIAGAGTIFLPAVAALICGPVFMLSVARVGKFGGITVMGVVIGLFLFVSGHFALSFVASIVFPLAGDLIARIGNYKNRVTILIGYVVFCYGLTGPILPLWFMKDAYVASLEARGKSADYINTLFSQISVGSFFVAMAAILVCGLIGGWFGQRILKKHFVKAGIA
ncbi:MptD family putative ECF transporter S component [Bifidobacterium sp. 82T10]|uniref:MptD family putative ECF transporter S component n=1 Tax=Bifidobacterium miconis TaxID=2834435 RepID=A0ABS6WGH2_9BIFI|nr:MptD family putative ECF transporter S component [Bifidobacterium miconis]MBW3093123.1 MptD family putative ECF transporter S component [Bifidobacterium miconis]